MRGTPLAREIPDDALQPAIRQAAGHQLAAKVRSVLALESPVVTDDVSGRQPPELLGELPKLRPSHDVLDRECFELFERVAEHVAAGAIRVQVPTVRIGDENAVHELLREATVPLLAG